MTKKFYPLASEYFFKYPPNKYRAIKTGEKRPPKKGEWYLSGAIVEAYQMPNDSTYPEVIAQLVLVKIEIEMLEIVKS